MDEVLEVVDLAADTGFEGILVWLFRLLGVVAIIAGIGLVLFTDVTLLLSGGLIGVGLLLLVVPSVFLFVAELFG